jgi:hypothetical protein
MFLPSYAPKRQLAADVFVVVFMLWTFTSAYAQAEEATSNAAVGRLNFEAADLPEANVEVDLSQEMFRDLFGIGDAAIAGVAEALLDAPKSGDGAKAVEIAAKQAEALRQIINLAGNVINEVHVRLYEDLPEGANAHSISKQFDEQLHADNWDTLARVRDDEDTVRVAAVRDGGNIRGIFVVVTENESLILANLVCNVSPENVQKLTSAATKIGLENGLAKQIQLKFGPRIIVTGDERAPVSIKPPAPPEPVKKED